MIPTHTVIHSHRHGISIYHVSCSRIPTEDEVIAACDIEYEPDRDDENLEIEPVGEIILIP